ncbi:BadF/BadG/BcrA/BcrD ATPase family protein [Asticcacaulis tiandongensis]|uniref:BadF/BadG/BcrA/BcrD ATPase family protein n=1 Tax=Asticcacaulis tiandongensis TaxID=2565365 RepID=UPI00112EF74F|nr:BadF/BadG/BcrA/BcrD ATPase family protein [Asticcacaulis tiandongensis]
MTGTSVNWFIGIDGGGTGCRARLRDRSGRVLGQGKGGAANIRLGLPTAWSHMLEAIDQALSEAGLRRDIFPETALGLGLAGITTSDDARRAIESGPDFGFVNAASDGHAACLGAFGGKDGAILITGTGSAGYAWVAQTAHCIGGWGFEVNDDGSAAVMGREAVRIALHGFDGIGPQSAFSRAIIDHLGGHPSQVVAFATTARPAHYGALAPIIMAHAAKGDALAVTLVQDAAQALGKYIRRLSDLGAPDICLMGGMAAPLTPWLSPWARASLSQPLNDAVDGALQLAAGAPNGLDASHIKQTEAMI